MLSVCQKVCNWWALTQKLNFDLPISRNGLAWSQAPLCYVKLAACMLSYSRLDIIWSSVVFFFFFLVINFLVQRMPNLLPDVPTVSIYLPVVDLWQIMNEYWYTTTDWSPYFIPSSLVFTWAPFSVLPSHPGSPSTLADMSPEAAPAGMISQTLFLMVLTVLRSPGQIVCRTPLHLHQCDVFLLGRLDNVSLGRRPQR